MPRHNSLKISASGVRGIVGESLTPQLVASFAAAFGNYCGAGPIMIGSDTRPSGEMIKQAAIAGLLSVGCTPVDVGIVPLPALMLHVRESGAFGGIGITASHNPIEWNALKFIGADGITLRSNQAAELTDLYHQGVYSRVNAQEMTEPRFDDSTLMRHRVAVISSVNETAIKARRFKVAVDCCNGAASVATPAFLQALGCEVVELYTDPSKPFPRDPEPLPENITGLCKLVSESGADLGFAQDGDGDRLAIINELGQPLGEDATIALAVNHWLKIHPGPVVVNSATTRMVDDVAQQYGCPVYRTPVGEVHVVERMLQCRASIGGEGNGGVILPTVNPCRDGFVGMALILEALAVEGVRISELRSRLSSYVMLRDRLQCEPRDIAPLLRLIRTAYLGQNLDFTDGIKVLWDQKWLQVRQSHTEPILRLTAEAPTEAEARALLTEALTILTP
ncbi:MAG: phosphoglucosamine mutase [Acidobacteriota bacterium]